MNYLLIIKDPNICAGTNPTSPEECPYCDNGPIPDYETNCYTLANVGAFCRSGGGGSACGEAVIVQHHNSGNGGGLSSYQLCCIRNCPTSFGIFPTCSCQEASSSCSCKGESTGHPMKTCREGLPTCSPPHGGGGGCDIEKIFEKLDNKKFIYKVYPNPDAFTRGGDWILVKNKPMNGYGTTNKFITDGLTVWDKDGICIGCNPSSNIATARVPRCGSRVCSKNRCLFKDSSCNKGSRPIYSQQDDMDTIFTNIMRTYTGQRSVCVGAGYDDYLGGFAQVNQGSCPINLIGDSFQNKRVYINETDFICVPLDCIALDCTQYQDCSI